MSEKQFMPKDWQDLGNKQSKEKDELAEKHISEKNVLHDQNWDEADKMDVQFDEAKAKLEEIAGKKLEVKLENSFEQKELFKVWKTIELGTGLKTTEDFEKALKEAGREISSGARELLKVVEKEIGENSSYEKEEVDLVEATPAELGLPNGGTLEQIYEAAKKKGLEKCSEAGPQSAIQYEDQPKDEYRLIGVDNRRAFNVYHNSAGKRWLDVYGHNADDVWYSNNPFVWVRRKKSELKS